jgi:hypothetical protein
MYSTVNILHLFYRPIRRKELLLTELPHVSGPSRERAGHVCVECLADVTSSNAYYCACGLPLCYRPGCFSGPNHRAECELLQELAVRVDTDSEILARTLDDLLPFRHHKMQKLAYISKCITMFTYNFSGCKE